MSCFPCFSNKKDCFNSFKKEDLPSAHPLTSPPPRVNNEKQTPSVDANNVAETIEADDGSSAVKTFTLRELATATKNFRQECLLSEACFGRVFRGTLQSSGQVVTVRELDKSGTQGSKEFKVEILSLSLLKHLNLINLIGYCADGDQRLLVYEYIPSGSLGNHLFDIPSNKKPLDWTARMKIASGIAQGLEYLHEKANPSIIYRDLNSSNILLDEVNNPKLSDYGLTKLVLSGNKMHLSPTMTSYGYCAPEYERHGELTLKSDVYSFGIVLLELITGRRALDTTRPTDEQSLVTWAQPIFREPKRFPDMADPLLNKEFPVTSLNQAVGVAAMCLTEEPSVRPEIGDVVAALSFLALAPLDAPIPPRLAPILSTRVETLSQHGNNSSIDQGTVSSHKNDNNFDIEVEDEEQKIHSNEQEDSGSSDFGYVDSSDSDHEDRNRIKYRNQNKSAKSRKWDSSSKHRSSRLSSWRSNESSSFGYSSNGYSLRCESKEDIPLAQDIIHKTHEYGAGSSVDEESLSDFGLKHRSRDGLLSINSRRSVDRDQCR